MSLKTNVWVDEEYFKGQGLYFFGQAFLNGHPVQDNEVFRFSQMIFESEERPDIDGLFTIVKCFDDKIGVYVSDPGFYPIFHTQLKEEFFISSVSEKLDFRGIDSTNLAYLKYYGFVPGDNTIYSNVFSFPCGRRCIVEQGAINYDWDRNSYAVSKNQILNMDQLTIKAGLKSAIDNAFDQLVVALNGRQAVIPLTAGYDSRLILTSLLDRKYDNILCFTYGKPGCQEVETARKVAYIAGVRWVHTDITDDFISQHNDIEAINSFFSFLSNGRSTVYLCDYFAMLFLKQSKHLHSNAIFIPGHSGDFLGGSQYVKNIPVDLDINSAMNFYSKNKAVMNRDKGFVIDDFLIFDQITFRNLYNIELLGYSVYEDIDLYERISKVVLNSSRVFEYFGYNVLFPFFNIGLVDYCKTMPIAYKVGKVLYNELLEDFFRKYKLAFSKEMQPSVLDYRIQNLKNRIKKLLPVNMQNRIVDKNDFLNYRGMVSPLLLQFSLNNRQILMQGSSYNEIMTQYLVDILFCNPNNSSINLPCR